MTARDIPKGQADRAQLMALVSGFADVTPSNPARLHTARIIDLPEIPETTPRPRQRLQADKTAPLTEGQRALCEALDSLVASTFPRFENLISKAERAGLLDRLGQDRASHGRQLLVQLSAIAVDIDRLIERDNVSRARAA